MRSLPRANRTMIRLAAACLLAGLPLAPSAASQADPTPLEAQARADQRLLDIGWQLARASAQLCPDTRPATGLMLRDARGYGDPAAVLSELGQSRDIAVQAIAADSPAQAAGLVRGDDIVSLNGTDPNTLPAEAANDWQRLHTINETIDAALALYGAIGIARAGEAEARLDGVPACYARFETIDNSDGAASTGTRVRIGTRWLAGDVADVELAFLVAHELAHNILKHRLRRELPRGERPSAREVERAADRLAPWLMARAGYDPAGAVAFLEAHGPGQDGFLYIGTSHDGWKSRREAIQREIAAIDGRVQPDWRPYFEAELAAARAVMPEPSPR